MSLSTAHELLENIRSNLDRVDLLLVVGDDKDSAMIDWMDQIRTLVQQIHRELEEDSL